MPNMTKIKTAMPEQDPNIRNRNFLEVSLGYNAELAQEEAQRCINCKHKPCIKGCPVNVQIPEFISLVAEGNFEEAYQKVIETNSLPAVCGRVCPQETQCEELCVRGLKGDPVGIGRLERFVADCHMEQVKAGKIVEDVHIVKKTGKKVAVIGSGPSGLVCAADLAKMGHDVTIFEAFHTPGGVLVYGIPEFRLPKLFVKAEIDSLKSLGVKIITNMVIGKTLLIEDLKKEGFDSFFIGSGAGLPTFMSLPGENLNGVYSSNEFLTRMNLMKAYLFPKYGTPVNVGNSVAVVGGGNVAMDAARSAKRLGAKDVYIIYRRGEEEMPARREEIHHAHEEGIIFKLLTNPIAIIGNDDGAVKGIECVEMELGEPDDSGRRRPKAREGSNHIVDVETVIIAIGNSPNPLIPATTEGLEVNKWGCIVVRTEEGLTSIDGVYAGGDVVTGAATVILAMGAGKNAASAIDKYLTEVRTRFAPSPTGYMHIGNLRTALYEYLIAKVNKGKFVLRIEDTDQERLIEGATEAIFKVLKLVGISHDEGPDIGGPFGPYIQSQRKDSYFPFAKKLVDEGKAYYCFCDKERLSDLKASAEVKGMIFVYDRFCAFLSTSEVEAKLVSGVPFIIRQKMPTEGSTTFEDSVFGSITVENNTLEDQVLIKSDGYPTYNFANVIDDHLMEITHVVRGSEYLSSTPKYNLLYEALGWDIPTYVHLPLIVKTDGTKISKRTGDASFEDLIDMGFLVQAVVNYIVLLGWSPDSNEEMFSLDELEKIFSVERISKSPSCFDMAKLRWFNAEYLRKLSIEEFHDLAMPYYNGLEKFDLMKVSKILQPRTEILTEISGKVDFLAQLPDYDLDMYIHKKMKTTLENSLESLKSALSVIKEIVQWEEQEIHDVLIQLAERLQIKNGQLLWPIRTAVSGKDVTPGGAIEIVEILGKDETISRLEDGISRLTKKLENKI